jgi:hypothetical protein
MKIPEPVTVATVFATGEKLQIPGYTTEQMLAWGKATAAAEREACAKLCLETEPFYGVMFYNVIRARGNT